MKESCADCLLGSGGFLVLKLTNGLSAAPTTHIQQALVARRAGTGTLSRENGYFCQTRGG